MKFIKIDYTLKKLLLHNLINIFKELKVRIKIKRVFIWMLLSALFLKINITITYIILIAPFSIIFLYIVSEVVRFKIHFSKFIKSDTSGYGLFFNDDFIQLYNGQEYGELIKYDAIWLLFNNKITSSITLFLKKDNSFINVFETKSNSIEFTEFKTIALKKIRNII